MTTTTENDDDDKARRATHAGHGLDLCLPLECGAIQEAGSAPKRRPSVPAGSLITVQSPNGPAWPVLPGQVTIMADS